jgi:acetate kinase
MIPENFNILVINGGSSSIKFAMYEMSENSNKILSGQITRIGLNNPLFTFTKNISDEINQINIDSKDFKEAVEFLINWLNKQNFLNDISCIGHRIVQGMEHTHPEIIDDSLLKELNKISEYDPDHLPAEIKTIELFKNKFPALLQVACFDTSFHTAMPRVAKILPIPRQFDKAGVRRYGFHGLSFAYLMEALNKIDEIQKPKERIILAHLGNGASLAAVKEGKSLDTTMGFTPAGGLVMGTRPGDIDPGVAWYIMQSEKLTPIQFNHLINHESGLLGISEISSDMEDLLKKESSDIRAAEAVALFCYQVKKWIGAFAGVLNGLDILVFSGGIGENSPVIRLRICENLDYLGIEINGEENEKNATIISTEKSKVKIYVIPTDEEIMIANDTRRLYINTQNKTH